MLQERYYHRVSSVCLSAKQKLTLTAVNRFHWIYKQLPWSSNHHLDTDCSEAITTQPQQHNEVPPRSSGGGPRGLGGSGRDARCS